MSDKFIVKDSGKRQNYESGMRRDTQDGKPRFDLVWKPGTKRLALHMAKGAIKYGENNWQKANSLEEYKRFKASAENHLNQWLVEENDEDHMSAAIFNMFAAEYVKDKMTNPKCKESRYLDWIEDNMRGFKPEDDEEEEDELEEEEDFEDEES